MNELASINRKLKKQLAATTQTRLQESRRHMKKGYEVIVSLFVEAESAEDAEKTVLDVLNNSADVNFNSVVATVLAGVVETYHHVQTNEEFVDYDADHIPALNGYARVTFVTSKHTAYAQRANPTATLTNNEPVILDYTEVQLSWDEALVLVGNPAHEHLGALNANSQTSPQQENTFTGERE